MTKDTIAVVIPLYNKEHFVTRAIASVLAQTRPVDEIIVVDDASTDGSLDKVRAFIDPRLKILRRDEPGPGGYAARNRAIRAATSRWIAFLDADDSWKPEFIEEISRLVACASDTIGCVFTGFEKVWSGNRTVRDEHSVRYGHLDMRSWNFESFVSEWIRIGSSPIWTSACAIRRDILIQVGLFPERRCRLGGDKDTWLRTIARADALSSPRPCATYHKHTENQVTRQETFNSPPCLCGTSQRMLAEATGERRTLLMRLFNREVFDCVLMIDPRERVLPDVHRGFFVSLDRSKYVLLLGLIHLPVPLRTLTRFCILRGKAVVRMLRHLTQASPRNLEPGLGRPFRASVRDPR